ncbi:MAG: general stress protein [Candidatus Nanogingivalaceae bacterium]|nr:general stress protein [Candidatus Nanogingivalaceae bacterium]
MAGTKVGGMKAAQKNLAKDPNFYAKIGRKGGQNGHTGGFAANPELARIAGAKGGRISRRGKTKAVIMQNDVTLAA